MGLVERDTIVRAVNVTKVYRMGGHELHALSGSHESLPDSVRVNRNKNT